MASSTRCQRPNGLTKRSYRSAAKARQAGRRISQSGRARSAIRVYECGWCGGWHITGAPFQGGDR